MARPLLLVVTPGDPDGIGPEIVWKSLRKRSIVASETRILCVGARKPFEDIGASIIEATEDLVPPPRSAKPSVWLLPAPMKLPTTPRRLLLEGYQTGWSIQRAARLVLSGAADAMVTGPISKERLIAGGFPFPGHTEFLAHLCESGPVTMMLANDQLRISLVTTHLALKDVSSAITRKKIRRAVLQTAEFLRERCGISRPEIGVCALNPHAGESGIFGQEEIRVIAPEIRSLQRAARNRYGLHGPLPADTLFANHALYGRQNRGKPLYDAVICMYHDQGLIPVKLLDFQRTVNVTLGLPMLRTSVDHGVAFDIAGKGIADPSSLESALRMAETIARSEMTARKATRE